MRLLCVTGYYKPAHVYGGPVQSVSAMCEALARAGHDVTVFSTNANGPADTLPVPTDSPVDVAGVNVHYFSLGWPLARIMPFYSPGLGRACRQHIADYDVIYIPATWTYAMYAGASSARRHRVPYVVSPRGSLMTWSMAQKAWKKRWYLALVERSLIDGARAIHCTSRLEQSQLREWDFKPATVVIPNSIPTRSYQPLPERGRLRQALGLAPDATLSLFVGRLHRMKRLHLMVEAFAQVARARPTAHLVLVGPDDDETAAEARQFAEKLGLASRLHWLGLLTGTALLQAYSDADLLVLLSHRENFGMVALEAMASGLPVLAAHEVGLAEDISQAGAGLAVEANAAVVAEAWARLLGAPELRRQMGQRGLQLVQQFDSDVVAESTLAMFRNIRDSDAVRAW